MKIIIAGSRSLHNYRLIEIAVDYSGWRDKIKEVVSGCAPGIDSLAIKWATDNGIKVKRMPANWNKIDGLPPAQIRTNSAGKKYNVRAGFERNEAMAQYVGPKGGLVAIMPVDGTPGTEQMIEMAKKYGVPFYVYQV